MSALVGNDFLLRYLENPADRGKIKHGFIRTEDIHRGDDGKDRATNRFYPLSSKTGEPIADQLHRISKQIAEEQNQKLLLENKRRENTYDEWGYANYPDDSPADSKFNSQQSAEDIEDLMEEIRERGCH